MPGLEEFFVYGQYTKDLTIGDITVQIGLLNTENFQDALEASNSIKDDVAKMLEFKKQILARAIMSCAGKVYRKLPNQSTKEEIAETYADINKLHILLINKFYDAYDELDKEVQDKLDVDIKK